MADLGIMHPFRGCSVKARDSLQIVLTPINLVEKYFVFADCIFSVIFFFLWLDGR